MTMRLSRSPAFWVITGSILVAIATNSASRNSVTDNASLAGDRPSLEDMSNESSMLREGTEIADVRGKFRINGERMVFCEDVTNRTYKCLENLMLQRIATTIKDDDRKINWVISARLSEYMGENYVLIDRAVRAR